MALGRSRVCERVSVCECALMFRMCTRLPAHLCSHREPRWGRRSLAGAAATSRGPRRPRRPRVRASGLPARQEGLRSRGLVGGPATAACPGPPLAPSSWCCASPRQNRVVPHATGPAVARQARAADLTPRAGFGVRKTSSSRVCLLFSPWLDWVVGFGKKGPSRPITARHAGHVPVTVDIDLDPC